MGRSKGKLKLEFIADKKTRNLTLQRRKENLVKKIKELGTLCDVDVCLIAYAPDHGAPIAVWGETRGMIDLYRAEKAHNFKNVKTYGVSDIMNAQKKARRELKKSKKQTELMDSTCYDHQFGPPVDQDTSTAMIVPRDPPVLMMGFEDEGCSSRETTDDHLPDSFTAMIVAPDPPVLMLGDSNGGFDEGCISTDHELYNTYDNNEILGQPMMTWQNDEMFMPTTTTTGPFDLGGGEEEGIKWADYLQCNINFDDFWVPAV